jgi:hypothetical protein
MSKVAIKGATTGTGTFTIESPATNTDRTLVLPDNAGTVLTSASDLAAANLSGRVSAANAPLGSVIQVVSVAKTDTFSMTGTTFTNVTGLSASITPQSATSKILVLVAMTCGINNDVVINTRITRNGTAVGVGDSAGSRTQASTGIYTGGSGAATFQALPQGVVYLDSPATTSSTAYQVQIMTQSGATAWVNRTNDDGDNTSRGRFSSTITVMEIAA